MAKTKTSRAVTAWAVVDGDGHVHKLCTLRDTAAMYARSWRDDDCGPFFVVKLTGTLPSPRPSKKGVSSGK